MPVDVSSYDLPPIIEEKTQIPQQLIAIEREPRLHPVGLQRRDSESPLL
jgi:hypothetical protein